MFFIFYMDLNCCHQFSNLRIHVFGIKRPLSKFSVNFPNGRRRKVGVGSLRGEPWISALNGGGSLSSVHCSTLTNHCPVWDPHSGFMALFLPLKNGSQDWVWNMLGFVDYCFSASHHDYLPWTSTDTHHTLLSMDTIARLVLMIGGSYLAGYHFLNLVESYIYF